MRSITISMFHHAAQGFRQLLLGFTMVIALAATGLMSPDAQASKRLGSGASTGKQSSIATQKQATPP
ncbi:MAG: hypothetical protein EBV92_08520, partial [Betaproteobacteria bacterium]|nr:hypothetical protein [Betaproteobacteria bacterium]